MGFNTKKETTLSGAVAYNLVAGDKVTIVVKGETALDYTVEYGKKGPITISIQSVLSEA